MLRAIRLVTVMAFTLVVFATTLGPALQRVITEMQSVMVTNNQTSSVIGDTTTVLFIGMPLLFIGGIVLVVFLIAVGIRGTSFQ